MSETTKIETSVEEKEAVIASRSLAMLIKHSGVEVEGKGPLYNIEDRKLNEATGILIFVFTPTQVLSTKIGWIPELKKKVKECKNGK